MFMIASSVFFVRDPVGRVCRKADPGKWYFGKSATRLHRPNDGITSGCRNKDFGRPDNAGMSIEQERSTIGRIVAPEVMHRTQLVSIATFLA
ncbi:hypothetical protein [Lysobacter rhizosphaerae]